MTRPNVLDAPSTTASEGRLPDFLIIGAMRSGTTSLARYLGAHPEVFMAPQKEVHFFDDNLHLGLDWYQRQFSGAAAGQVIGEATPRYMYDREAMTRMRRILPAARLVVVLRNPVDRAYSHYWLVRSTGREPLEFPEAVRAEPIRLAMGGEDSHTYAYLDRSRYLPQLLSVCELYPREAVLVMLFEDVRDDPEGGYRRACEFIGVDPVFRPESLGNRLNRAIEYRSQWAYNVTQRLPRTPKRVLGRLNARPIAPPPMDAATRAELLERFADHNQALAAWLGRDVSAWER